MIAVLFLAAAGAAAVPSPAPGGPDAELLDEIRDVVSRIDAVRGARPPYLPVPVRAGAGVRAAVAEASVDRILPHPRLEARGRAWESLGFGDGRTPRALAIGLAADLDGIALDDAGRRLLVDPARLSAKDFGPTEGPEDEAMSLLLATGVRPDEPLVAHLLVHALVASRGGETVTTTDAALARAAWTEGEANLVALLYLFRGLGLEKEVVAGHMDPKRVLGGRLVPALGEKGEIERSFLEFAYLEGFAQVRERLARGGWGTVAEAARTRRTTRDVLHADRPAIVPTPFDPPHPPDGFEVADVDSLGEQGIVTLVSVLTGKDNLGLLSGDGWTGDALFRLEPPGKSSEGYTQWESSWAAEDRARDFAYGVRRTVEARYPGTPIEADPEGGWRAATADAVWRLRRSGVRVTVRVASPALDSRLEKGPVRAPAKPKR